MKIESRTALIAHDIVEGHAVHAQMSCCEFSEIVVHILFYCFSFMVSVVVQQLLPEAQRPLLLCSAASYGGSAVPYCYARLPLMVAQLFLPLCLAAGSLTHHIEEKRWFLDVVHHAMYVQSYIIFRNYSLWRMNFFAKNI